MHSAGVLTTSRDVASSQPWPLYSVGRSPDRCCSSDVLVGPEPLICGLGLEVLMAPAKNDLKSLMHSFNEFLRLGSRTLSRNCWLSSLLYVDTSHPSDDPTSYGSESVKRLSGSHFDSSRRCEAFWREWAAVSCKISMVAVSAVAFAFLLSGSLREYSSGGGVAMPIPDSSRSPRKESNDSVRLRGEHVASQVSASLADEAGCSHFIRRTYPQISTFSVFEMLPRSACSPWPKDALLSPSISLPNRPGLPHDDRPLGSDMSCITSSMACSDRGLPVN